MWENTGDTVVDGYMNIRSGVDLVTPPTTGKECMMTQLNHITFAQWVDYRCDMLKFVYICEKY